MPYNLLMYAWGKMDTKVCGGNDQNAQYIHLGLNRPKTKIMMHDNEDD